MCQGSYQCRISSRKRGIKWIMHGMKKEGKRLKRRIWRKSAYFRKLE